MTGDQVPWMLTTERLVLYPYAKRFGRLTESDWLALRAMDTDPEVQRHRGGEIISEELTRHYLQRVMQQADDPARTHYPFAVTTDGEDQLIGSCFLNITDPGLREAELGYVFHRGYWGQGYATEAGRSVLSFGFGQLSLHRVWARCTLSNQASAHVLEKLGMRREGHLRENQRIDGRWLDTLLYAILDREWESYATPSDDRSGLQGTG
jgi:RimJ/RimL family protein N-acetyltransferase